jgi:hypothetical protein
MRIFVLLIALSTSACQTIPLKQAMPTLPSNPLPATPYDQVLTVPYAPLPTTAQPATLPPATVYTAAIPPQPAVRPTTQPATPLAAQPAAELPIDYAKSLEMAVCALGAASVGLAYRSIRKSLG